MAGAVSLPNTESPRPPNLNESHFLDFVSDSRVKSQNPDQMHVLGYFRIVVVHCGGLPKHKPAL